jgi:hypothetical protein
MSGGSPTNSPRHHPLLAGLVVATTIEKPADQFFQLIG